MLSQYLPILILVGFAAGFVILLFSAAHILGPRSTSPAKEMPYECGVPPTGSSRNPFSVKFFLVALFFIIFDIEVVFLFPWALVFRDLVAQAGGVIIVDMAVFLGILLVGLAYVWKKGALEWE